MTQFRIGCRVRPRSGVLPHQLGNRDWNNPEYELTVVDTRTSGSGVSLKLKIKRYADEWVCWQPAKDFELFPIDKENPPLLTG